MSLSVSPADSNTPPLDVPRKRSVTAPQRPSTVVVPPDKDDGVEFSSHFHQITSVEIPAPVAKTHFGVSRHVLLVFFCVYAFSTGCCYWGWDGMQDMFYKSGAFAWQCAPGDPTISLGGVDYPACEQRKNALLRLNTTAFACHFGFSALAGVLLDLAGSKICGVVGLSFTGLGWILLANGGETMAGAYFAGVAFIGAGADTGNLPILSLGNLYPGNESLILSILGSIRSLSFAVPVIMARIYLSDSYTPSDFSKFCYGYVGLAVGLAFIVCLVLIPWRPFHSPGKTKEQAAEPVEQEAAARARRLSVYTGTMMPPVSTSARDLMEIADELRGKRPDYSTRRASYMLPPGERRKSVMAVPEEPMSPVTERLLEDYPTYLSNLKRPEFILIVPFFCLCLIRGQFFAAGNKELLQTSSGSNCWRVYSIFNILSFLPGPVFGKLCDTIGILWVIFILNFCGIFVYTFVIFDVIAPKIVAVFFLFIYTSFVLSNLYCYVADVFPTEHFGKLTGFASFVGGMFTLLSIPLYAMSTSQSFTDDLGAYAFAPACGIMIGFGIINIVLWLFMKWIQKRKRKAAAAHAKLMDVVTPPEELNEGNVVEKIAGS